MPPQSSRCERARFWPPCAPTASSPSSSPRCSTRHVARLLVLPHLRRSLRGDRRRVARGAPRAAGPLVLRPRQARGTGLRALQVVVAAAVVVSAGVAAAVTGPSGSTAAAKPVAMVAGADLPDRLRELRRPALVAQGRTIPRTGSCPATRSKGRTPPRTLRLRWSPWDRRSSARTSEASTMPTVCRRA